MRAGHRLSFATNADRVRAEIMLKARDDEVLIQPADRQHTHNPATELTNNDLTDNGAQPPNSLANRRRQALHEPAIARCVQDESSSRYKLLFEHDLRATYSAFVAKENRSPARIKCGGMLFRIMLQSIDESIHVEDKLVPRDPRAEHRDKFRRDRSRGEARCPAGRQ